MRLSKNEIICIREALKPLNSGIINTKQAAKLLVNKSHINGYRYDVDQLTREQLQDIATELDTLTEPQLIDRITYCKEVGCHWLLRNMLH